MEGMGSPHTPPGHVWPLAVITRAMTADNREEVTAQCCHLTRMQARCGGLLAMRESVSVKTWGACARPRPCLILGASEKELMKL